MKNYLIEVTQLVKDSTLDFDDLQDNPAGQHYIAARNEVEALDEFHKTIAISCLEHFSIEVQNETN